MRKLMKPLLLSVGLFVCPAVAICQHPVPATLSLADAIALAREHNPAYRQTIHDRSPAAWGVRNAWSSLGLPSVTASGGVGYAGPGEQNFLTSSFSQGVSTWSSSYSFLLDWTLNGQTLSQPGLKKAQLNAADADVRGAETNVVTAVTQQYLTVLQARGKPPVAAAPPRPPAPVPKPGPGALPRPSPGPPPAAPNGVNGPPPPSATALWCSP